MFNPFTQAGFFLIQVIFDLYIFVVMLRAVLEWRGVNLLNPFLRIIVKLTEPVLRYFRQVIPIFRGIDLAIIVFLLLLEVVKFILLLFLESGIFPHLLGLFIYAFASLLSQLITIFFWSIIVVIVLSWLGPFVRHPLILVLQYVVEPLLSLARRYIPLIGGLDLSPILVLLSLKLIDILLVTPLLQMGFLLALHR